MAKGFQVREKTKQKRRGSPEEHAVDGVMPLADWAAAMEPRGQTRPWVGCHPGPQIQRAARSRPEPAPQSLQECSRDGG